MNEKYKMFCQYYLFYNDLNKAADLIGYKESTAKNLLKNNEVKQYLSSMKYKIASSNEIMECLTSIMRGHQNFQYPSLEPIPNNDSNNDPNNEHLSNDIQTQAINLISSVSSSNSKQVSTREQLKAAELLGKALSIFSPKSSDLSSSLSSNSNETIIFLGCDEILD